MANGEEFERGKREGCMEEKVMGLKASANSAYEHFEDIYKRLNSIDKKLAAMSPLMRIVEAAVITGIASGIALVVK